VGAEGATDEERSAALEAVINPDRISVTTAPGNDAIIVSAPADAFPVLDQFISLLDQSPTDTRTATRRFAVDNADVTEISRTLQQIFTSRFQADRRNLGSNVPSLVEARFYADRRTSTIYVTGTTEQFGEIEEMLASLDAPLSAEAPPLTLIEVEGAQPSRLARIIDQVVIGQDPGRRERTSIVPDDASQLLLVRAEPEELELINRIVSEVDRFEMKDLPIRAIKLSRADADQTARALLQFFDDRARISQRPGQPRPPRQISVVGDRRSGTVFVAANDEDFAEVENLINTLDAPSEAEDLQFQIVPLRHARAAAVSQIIESMGWQLIYGSGRGRGIDRGQLSVQPDERTNSIIVSGSGESFAIVEQIVRSLDVPAENRLDRAVRVVMIENGDTNLIARAARETFTSNQPSWWWDQGDDDEVRIISDPASKTLILSGLEDDLDPVVAFVTELDSAAKRPDQKIEIIDLQHARANVVAASLTRFFRDRARVARLPEPAITISPAPGAEKIVISATESELALINDLLQEIDVSVEGDDRRIELYVLENGRSMDAARTIQQLFPNRGVAADQMVTVTSDARTNSLVISAPGERMSEIEGVIAMVDAPQASEERIIRTFALTNARADEAAAILTEVLNLSQAPQSRRGRDLLGLLAIDRTPGGLPGARG